MENNLTLPFLLFREMPLEKKDKKVLCVSLERVLRILQSLGFSNLEAEVYIYLSKTGPKDASTIKADLSLTSLELNSVLKSLKQKKVTFRKIDQSVLIMVLPFGDLLDQYVKLNFEKAESIKQIEKELLDSWREIIQEKNS
jgi:hypothetical protein